LAEGDSIFAELLFCIVSSGALVFLVCFFFGVVLLFFQILDAGVALLVWNYLAYFLGVFLILIAVCLFYVGGEI